MQTFKSSRKLDFESAKICLSGRGHNLGKRICREGDAARRSFIESVLDELRHRQLGAELEIVRIVARILHIHQETGLDDDISVPVRDGDIDPKGLLRDSWSSKDIETRTLVDLQAEVTRPIYDAAIIVHPSMREIVEVVAIHGPVDILNRNGEGIICDRVVLCWD